MSNGRYRMTETRNGFDRAAQDLTKGLSSEAAHHFIHMVKEVATEYGYSDSVMIRRLRSRLNRAARSKAWASEVLMRLEGATS